MKLSTDSPGTCVLVYTVHEYISLVLLRALTSHCRSQMLSNDAVGLGKSLQNSIKMIYMQKSVRSLNIWGTRELQFMWFSHKLKIIDI